jgi:hypothetical protein
MKLKEAGRVAGTKTPEELQQIATDNSIPLKNIQEIYRHRQKNQTKLAEAIANAVDQDGFDVLKYQIKKDSHRESWVNFKKNKITKIMK